MTSFVVDQLPHLLHSTVLSEPNSKSQTLIS